MSDDGNNEPKLLRIHMEECERNPEHMHVTRIEPITADDILYDAPGSDDILASSSVGWSRAYANNWDANFAEKAEPELN